MRVEGLVVTVPAYGTIREAEAFVIRNREWIERHWAELQARTASRRWTAGSQILFRGEWFALDVEESAAGQVARFADQQIVMPLRIELRDGIERHLALLAADELFTRTVELAREHRVPLRRVQIRSQRSRWGSCSARGTVSLNWRLIQMPAAVRDYVILHELMHFRQMNHSALFWNEVEQVCPGYRSAKEWLARHAGHLR